MTLSRLLLVGLLLAAGRASAQEPAPEPAVEVQYPAPPALNEAAPPAEEVLPPVPSTLLDPPAPPPVPTSDLPVVLAPAPAGPKRSLLPKVLIIAGFAEFGASWLGSVVDAAILGDGTLAIPVAGGVFAALKAGDACWGGGSPPCTPDYLGVVMGVITSVLQVAGLVVGVVGLAKLSASTTVEVPALGSLELRLTPVVANDHTGLILVGAF